MLDVGELLADDLARRGARGRGSRTRTGTSPRSTARRAAAAAARRARTASSSSGEQHVAVEVDALGDRDARPAPGDRERRRVATGPRSLPCGTRRISISSRWPSVTSSPVGAPFISIIVLSAVVVPCTTMSSSRAEARRASTPKRSASCAEPVHHAGRLVVERGRRLVEHDLAVGRDADEVGERAADVDPDPVAHRQPRSALRAARSARSVRRSRRRRPRA